MDGLNYSDDGASLEDINYQGQIALEKIYVVNKS